jgi:hypothetical protein
MHDERDESRVLAPLFGDARTRANFLLNIGSATAVG